MVKDKSSFNAQIGMETVLQCRIRFFLLLVLFFNTILFTAQQKQTKQKPDSQPLITVVGEAVIYSNDEDFNKQIRNNKNLQSNSNLEIAEKNNNLQISSKKVDKKNKAATSPKKKKENIILAAKEEKEKKYQANLAKKEIDITINSKDFSTEFLPGSSTGHFTFIAPNNDSASKFFTASYFYQKRLSVKFWNTINYFYKNRNFKRPIPINKLSVRPPPVLFL